MITSTSNAQVKNIINLMTKSRYRNKQQAYVVEGIRMFMEVPREKLTGVYIAADSPAMKDEQVQKRLKNLQYEVLSDSVFKSISGTVTPQGILAVVKMQEYKLDSIINEHKNNALYLVLEDLQDPGNLGTIMRTAEATGVSAIIMSKNTVDIYNPKVIRSTMGTIFRVPFVYEENILETTSYMKKCGIHMVAARLDGDKWYDEIDCKNNIAFMIGNEGNGLSNELSGLADELMKIPMEGKVESLNAAVASSILMYEAYRQRRS